MPTISKEHEGEAVRHAAQCLLCLGQNLSGMETSQVKNLLEAAVAARDVRALQSWVMYQGGRTKGTNPWRSKSGQDKTFGDRVIDKIIQELPLHDEPSTSSDRLNVIRTFAGQLARLHKAADGAREGNDTDWRTRQWQYIVEMAN